MKRYLETLDRQILKGLRLGREQKPRGNYQKTSQICFFGMGGSAISGDILASLNSGKIPFHVYRAPHFPKWAGPETLAIFSSYSGNTLETLTAFRESLKSKAQKLIVTSGGKLEKLGEKKKIPMIRIQKRFPPRCAIGYLTFSLIPFLQEKGWIHVSNNEIREAVAKVRAVSRVKAKQLARQMAGHFIHFYGAHGFSEPVLARWRAQMAENAKTLSSSHLMPEMFHNEIEGWNLPKKDLKNHLMVFLTEDKVPSWLASKIKKVQNITLEKTAGYLHIKAQGRSRLAQLFSLIALGDWTSYELALLNKVNPLMIPAIEAVKKIK